uniref:Uncharacterized protein n=1 Tax=Romanomermis culicivorax TaxID=13658 RepID=A0A915JR30_ROMCU
MQGGHLCRRLQFISRRLSLAPILTPKSSMRLEQTLQDVKMTLHFPRTGSNLSWVDKDSLLPTGFDFPNNPTLSTEFLPAVMQDEALSVLSYLFMDTIQPTHGQQMSRATLTNGVALL